VAATRASRAAGYTPDHTPTTPWAPTGKPRDRCTVAGDRGTLPGEPMTVNVPILETERLTLRGHGVETLDEALALWSDPVVNRHIGGRPSGREEVWARILRYIGHWAIAGYGFWHIRERATGRFVGEAGLADFKRDLAFSFDGAPETGWVLAPWAHGKGYATEAMTAVLAWCDATATVGPRTVCIINPDNVASLRVAGKCDYRELARADYKGIEVIVLERGGR
jgi:RimJ/RimL family protein N-acetyltransferase